LTDAKREKNTDQPSGGRQKEDPEERGSFEGEGLRPRGDFRECTTRGRPVHREKELRRGKKIFPTERRRS